MSFALPLAIPRIETERLILRGFEPRDFEPAAEFYADPLRSPGFGGPLRSDESWRWCASNIGHWVIHGFGFWTIEEKATGDFAGFAGLWSPEGWPEPELGWALAETAERKGYAFEAAMAARDHAYGVMGRPALISTIKPGNDRSIRLAERMGARLESRYDNDMHGEMLIYRHPEPHTNGARHD